MKLLVFVMLLFAQHGNSSPLRGTRQEFGAETRGMKQDHDPETLQELLSDQQEVTEGDILLLSDRNAVGRAWPTLDLPYDINPGIDSRTGDISAAMTMVSEHTCVTFHKRNSSEPDFLHFTSGTGCGSYVGFVGGEQSVLIAPSCSVGNIAHEILHALGFHHEHSREDRDQYISIEYQNIIKGKEDNFRKHNGKTFNISYDFTSIMHYGRKFFSSNGEATIIPNMDVKELGQRKRMQKSDIQKVRQLYHCDSLKAASS
ncbi:astacin-like metalloendopeptidase [Melanotaenia boesemani]|uniref:astacin-like metalloendopeptidase n=1 Tax=Melanotaenia boesemani TaxID=1250792 RepID=UPI001C050D32|nr:astacin-like metalloendopeptidase [Melanotaenia boesemani]